MAPIPAPVPAVLDEFIPEPDVVERFDTLVEAPADLVFDVACGFDMQSIPLVKAIFRFRELLTGSTAIPRRPQGLVAEMTSIGWGVLREDPGRTLAAGAICQPWLPDVRFRPVPSGPFAAYVEPEHVKIAWTIEAIPLGPARTRLATETRVVATDAMARARFRRYWRWAGYGIVAIRRLLLPALRRRAEAAWREEQRR